MSNFYAATEHDHWTDYCEDNGLDPILFTLDDYRERMWDAEQDRREVAANEGF